MTETRTVLLPRCGRCAAGKHSACENPDITDFGCCCVVKTEQWGDSTVTEADDA